MKKITYTIVYLVILLLLSSGESILFAASVTSAASGPWSQASTWAPDPVPSSNDSVTIDNGHTVTIDVTNAAAGSVVVQSGASLSFSSVTDSQLTVSNGDLWILTGGVLAMGTSGSRIPSTVKATLVLPNSNDRLYLPMGSQFYVYGAVKSPVAAAVSFPDNSSVNVPAAGAAGWQIGDDITISPSRAGDPFVHEIEKRTIANIQGADPRLITFDSPLNYPRDAGEGVRVANLTRNVLIRGAGSDPDVYIDNEIVTDGEFHVEYGEFAHLNYMRFHTDAARGLISSSTIRDCRSGLVIHSNNNEARFFNNIVYNNSSEGVFIDGSQAQIKYNDFIYNGYNGASGGIFLGDNAESIVIESNYFYSQRRNGICSYSPVKSIQIADNVFFCNAYRGVHLAQAGQTHISSNVFKLNGEDGLYVEGSSFVSISSNTFRGNSYSAAYLWQNTNLLIAGNTVINNCVHDRYANALYFNTCSASVIQNNHLNSNGAQGIFMLNADNNVLAENTIYNHDDSGCVLFNGSSNNLLMSNHIYQNGIGLDIQNASLNTLSVEDVLGYNAAGDFRPNSTDEMTLSGGSGIVFKKAKYLKAPDDYLYTSQNNDYIVSFLDSTEVNPPVPQPGLVRVQGDYTANADVVLDHVQPSYHAAASLPLSLVGEGDSASVTAVSDANAVTQTVFVRYESDLAWHVQGSVSGDMGTHSGNGAATAYAQFTLTFNDGGSANAGDVMAFALTASAGDENQQKRLLFDRCANGLNSGRSQAHFPSGTGLALRGINGTPALVDQMDSNYYYHLSVNGVLAIEHAELRNIYQSGLALSGNEGVSISNALFDQMGVVSGARCAYLTLTGLDSTAVLSDVTFGASRSTNTASSAYNIDVQGADANLDWSLDNWLGAMAGPENEYDPNDKLKWRDGAAPGAITVFQADPGPVHGQIDLTWTASGNNGANDALLPGAWHIFYSSTAADMAGAVPAMAQVVISTRAAPGTGHGHTVSNLELGKDYYARIWAQDETPNYSALSIGATSQAGNPSPPEPGLVVTPFPREISLVWPPISTSLLPTVYHGGYELWVSTVSSTTHFALLQSFANTENQYFHTSLESETTYYYRLYTLDTGGQKSTPSERSVKTLDFTPPAAVVNLLAEAGDESGEVRLTWMFPGDNMGAKTLLPGSEYAIQYTDDPGTVVWSTAGAVHVSTGNVLVGAAQSHVISGLTVQTEYYFRLWTIDDVGNVSAPSNITNARSRDDRPSVVLASPQAKNDGSTPLDIVLIFQFSKFVQADTVASSCQLKRTRDNLGNTVDENVTGAFASNSGNDVFTFTPSTVLQGNSLYDITISTHVLDEQGNGLAQRFFTQFLTVMNRTEQNKLINSAYGVTVDIPADSLASDGYLLFEPKQAAAAASATQKLQAVTQDPYNTPVEGTMMDLKIYDAFQSLQDQDFSRLVSVTLSYPDADDDGKVDGTYPSALEKTLSVYWLDEVNDLWVRLPSEVNSQANQVTAQALHFTTFALMAQANTDVSQAYAFPVPFRSDKGDRIITFTGIGQVGRVNIYTTTGKLVKEIPYSNGSGQVTWDVTNQDNNPIATGVYLYRIKSGESVKKGKIAIVR